MLLLSELEADGAHANMQRGADYILERLAPSIKETLEREEIGLGCFWANYLRHMLHCQKFGDTRVKDVICILQGEIARKGLCQHNYDLPCAWAVIRALWALALIPQDQRSKETRTAIHKAIDFILDRKYSLVRADYPYKHKIHTLWQKLSFPLFYQTDILFTLRVLKEVDALGHPNAQEALDWLREKRGKNGRWRGSSPYRPKTWPFVQEPDGVDQWITLQAMTVLQ